ncbi:hypothetical protein ACVNHC_01250 [Pannonibacter sp. Q-1]
MLLLGRVVAWLALVLGGVKVIVGFFVASVDDPMSRAELAARYLGSRATGEAIDQGIYIFLFGVVLGVLVKIGRLLQDIR